jgi:hypothetical protein
MVVVPVAISGEKEKGMFSEASIGCSTIAQFLKVGE